MSQSKRMRMAQLEQRVDRYLDKRKTSDDLHVESDSRFMDKDGYLENWIFQMAFSHAISLAYLIRFGDPKVGEPLEEAWKRTGYQGSHNPFCRGEFAIGDLRSSLYVTLPGASEKEKLDLVFEAAPAWLIWYAYGDYSADCLNLKLPPDFLSVVKLPRPKGTWPTLPSGQFEYGRRLARDSQMSPRQRKRAPRIDAKSPSHPPIPIRWPDPPTTR